jgi:hypothetical protein
MHEQLEKNMPVGSVGMVRLSRVTLSMHISVCFDRNSGLADAGIRLVGQRINAWYSFLMGWGVLHDRSLLVTYEAL